MSLRTNSYTGVVDLAKSIAVNKGRADEAVLENFFAAGYDEAAVIELIAWLPCVYLPIMFTPLPKYRLISRQPNC